MPPPIPVQIAHAAPGRLRLRAPDLVNEPERTASLIEALAGVKNLTKVVGRPSTGSLIFHFDGAAAEFATALFSTGRLVVQPAAKASKPEPVAQQVAFGLARMDFTIRKQTAGAFDMRTLLALMLFAAAVFQASRGNLMGPTTTLLISALSLMSDRTSK